MMRLNVKALTVACGLIWGFGVFAFTWWRLLFEKPQKKDDTLLGHIYRGYSITPAGSFVGFLWGLADGAAAGLVLAWLYNKLADRMPINMKM